MFKRNKHVFTCPDVIYLRAKAKRNTRILLITEAVLVLGTWIALDSMEKKWEKEDLTENTKSEFPQYS